MKIFLTGDTHYRHANILHLANRPFESIEQHDAELISAWNRVVGKDDLVFHLGDLTLGGQAEAKAVLERLNGKIAILGNPWHHDKRWLNGMLPYSSSGTSYCSANGEKVQIAAPMVVIEDVDMSTDGRGLPATLAHYPLAEWDRKHYGAYHFHGHSHGKLAKAARRLDVGVDSAYALVGAYRPLQMGEAIELAKYMKGD